MSSLNEKSPDPAATTLNHSPFCFDVLAIVFDHTYKLNK
jgi:hypothetical protein